jgi:hypothetical protein
VLIGVVVKWEGPGKGCGWIKPEVELGHGVRLPISNTPGNVPVAAGTRLEFRMGKGWDSRHVKVLGTSQSSLGLEVSE